MWIKINGQDTKIIPISSMCKLRRKSCLANATFHIDETYNYRHIKILLGKGGSKLDHY